MPKPQEKKSKKICSKGLTGADEYGILRASQGERK
jgi:hypothetical protein